MPVFIELNPMLSDLTSFFTERLTPPDVPVASGDQHEVRFAAAALLVVCARADFEEHAEEQSTIIRLLETTFDLSAALLDELLALVDPDAAVSDLQEFTGLVNQHYSKEEKLVLIENLWRVAFADGRLDRFEEQYVARVAFMIGIKEDEVKTARLRAADG